MKLGRWGRVFSSILVLSFLLACFVFPLFETRVEASAQNARVAPVEGTSVTIESDSFFGGNISFSLRLNGCSGYKKATITVVFSANCAIRQQRGYVAPTCSDGSSAYFTDRKTLTVTTTDRSALKGESSISISGAVNAEVTVSSAQVSSAELKDEIFLQEEYAVVGDDRFNQVSFGYYNMNGTLELKVTKAYEKSGKDVNISINDGGNTIGITVTTKDLSPITDMTICLEITADGNPRFGNYRPTYNYIEPTPTPTPTPSPTPEPTATPTPTPEPTATPTPMPIVETTVETTVAPTATPKPTNTPTPVPESSETTEETTSEETSETEPTVIAPIVPETEPSDTEPEEETTTSEETKKAVVAASTKSDDSTDYSTYILLGILFILVILIYLRYNHLAKKEMSFPDICKNFIPVGAVIEKVKSMKKSKEPDPDEPKPEVMNGYLQKPTVGMAAARAIRPVRSNVSGTEDQKKPETTEKKAAPADSPAPQRPGRRAAAPNSDPALAEMERRQKIMEQELNQLFSNKNKMKTDIAPDGGEGSANNG